MKYVLLWIPKCLVIKNLEHNDIYKIKTVYPIDNELIIYILWCYYLDMQLLKT